MKKAILTTTAMLFIGLASFAQEASECAKMCEKKGCSTECKTPAECKEKCEAEKGNKPCMKEGMVCPTTCTEGEKKKKK